MKNLFISITVLILFLSGFGPAAHAQTGGTDITLPPNAVRPYKLARVSVAFDGTIYVGHIFGTTPGGVYDQWEVVKSSDKGATFLPFMNGAASSGSYYTAFDIVAAGTDNGNFRLFVARATRNPTTGENQLLLTGYTSNGTVQNVPLPNAEYTYAPRGYASVSLATDSRDKSSEADPYSVSLAAAKSGAPNDSILVWTSNDAYASLSHSGVYGTSEYIRTVSASLGSTASATSGYGTLGLAWEELTNSTSSWGTINLLYVYASTGSIATNGGPFMSATGFRNPTLALSQNTAGSVDIRTIVLVEYADDSEGTNIFGNVIDGILLSAPDFGGNPIVANGPGGQIHPHIAYDVLNDNFLITYYDSATHALVYKQKPFAGVAGDVPGTVATDYRAATTPMSSPYPRVDMGSIDNKAVFVWNDGDSTLFDAEISYVSIQQNTLNLQNLTLYPNPAQEHITLTFNAPDNDNLSVRIIDMAGKPLYSFNTQVVSGNNQLPLPLPDLAAGQYVLLLQGQHIHGTLSFTIHR